MYHSVEDICNKVDVLKEKADFLRSQEEELDSTDPILQYLQDDIIALCRDIGCEGKFKK